MASNNDNSVRSRSYKSNSGEDILSNNDIIIMDNETTDIDEADKELNGIMRNFFQRVEERFQINRITLPACFMIDMILENDHFIMHREHPFCHYVIHKTEEKLGLNPPGFPINYRIIDIDLVLKIASAFHKDYERFMSSDPVSGYDE